MGLTAEEIETVRLSLEIAFWATSGALPVAILTGVFLARMRFPGKPLFDALVHLPMVLPPVVVGYVLLLLLGIRGPLGSVLYHVFGVRLVFRMAGAAVAAAVMAFPLMVRTIRLSAEAVDPGLEAAARTLGAGPLDRFATVTLPLMLPGVLGATVIGFATCLGDFGAIITFAANIPGETRTLPLAIYTALQTPGGDAVATRLATVSLVLAVAALILSERLGRQIRRLTQGREGTAGR
jgi:molybdate transport system permease protein